jgi:tRNA1Val (adenine37-N6)-methyltransferase
VRRLDVKPTETKPVNRVILEFSYISNHLEQFSLTVKTGDSYSDNYKSLTKDFYL